jgi:hypothetical protein
MKPTIQLEITRLTTGQITDTVLYKIFILSAIINYFIYLL